MNYDKEDEDQEIEIYKLKRAKDGGELSKKEERWRRIDLFRRFFGRKGSAKYDVRVRCFDPSLFSGEVSEDDSRFIILSNHLSSFLSEDPTELVAIKDAANKVLDKLSGEDRCYFVLRFYWGFTLDEIADCFGITNSAVSQRIDLIHKKIRKIVKYQR